MIFNFILIVHIILGIISLISGFIAMVAAKKKGVHTRYGEMYHAIYVGIAVTAIILSIMRWDDKAFLFYVAIFSYGLAFLGYWANKRKVNHWLKWHIIGMLGSYIGAVTALMVTVVPQIPVWSTLYPPIWNWFLPTIIGSPIISILIHKYAKPKSKSTT